MATTPKKNEQTPPTTSSASGDDKSKASGELADPTFEPGQQTVDPKKDQVLPASKPDEIAPVPDAAGKVSTEKPEASSTGYRVAEGKSVTAKTGDLLNAGDEIGEKHIDGGAERLEELRKAGVVESVGGSSSPSSSSSSSSSSSTESKPDDQQPPKDEKKGFFG